MRRTLVLLVLIGCTSDGGGDDTCALTPGGAAVPAQQLRNPETGQCEFSAGGGGQGCYGDPLQTEDWASCYGFCEGLDEATCKAADTCRAIYVGAGPTGGDTFFYAACWGTAPTGPQRGGSCDGLDAYACSLHDDCSAVHADACGGALDCAPSPAAFQYCSAEIAPPPTTRAGN